MRNRIALPITITITTGLGLAACSGAQKQANAEMQSFECKDRMASYVATHHLAGEVGVQLDCGEAGPRLKRWRVDKQGTREEDTRGMTPGEFDKVWNEIDGSGWAYLKDCSNGSLEERDPVYVFDIKDDQQKGSFQCQSATVPYPYNTIVDPLDAAAHKGRKQLGDIEPVDLKQYEKKDMQK